MGVPFSRPSRSSSDSLGRSKRKLTREKLTVQQNITPMTPTKIPKNIYNDAVIDATRKQLQNNFSTFILNQMLLGIQFFGNFEREKAEGFQRCYSFEKEIADKLENFSIILPNVLDEVVEKQVRYKPKHGPNKSKSSKLCPQQVYVVFEKLEISKMEDPNYAEISPPTKKLFIETENCNEEDLWKAKKGYIRLKLQQHLTSRTIRNPHFRDDSCEYSTECSLSECCSSNVCSESVGEQFGYWTSDSRKSSGIMTNSTSNTYDYMYTTKLNTHLPLNELQFNEDSLNLEETTIPSGCISELVLGEDGLLHPKESDVKNEDPEHTSSSCEEDQIEDDDTASDYSDETLCDCPQHDHTEVTVTVSYLNSTQFLSYFAEILKTKIAPTLGITEYDLDDATFREASVFVSSYEVIPALHYPHWPACASDFVRRQRKIHFHYGKKVQWPTPEMISSVRSFGCHAIPVGYSTKTKKNLTRDLEWKIVFPKAERYLESQLLSTQAKIYMLCKALIKAHLEPHQTSNIRMFTLDHLRAHLFWSCEENFMAWPDRFLGDALLRFLKSFLKRLSVKELPDYFIPQRNLFANIPQSSMTKFHQLITKIVWNAVMYTTRVYRDLDLGIGFYPKFDYQKLYNSIVGDPLLLRLSEMHAFETPSQNNSIASIKNGKKIGQRNLGNKGKERNRRKKKREQKSAEVTKRASVDSIDLQFTINDAPIGPQNEYHSSPDDIRRILVLKTFVSFFISMAKAAINLKALDQSELYINHCDTLCTILKEFGEDIFETRSRLQIKLVEKHFANSQELTDGPALPIRTNLESVRSLRQYKQRLPMHNGTQENGRFEKGGKSVQFDTVSNFVEPRSSLFTVSDLHGKKNIVNISRTGIMKQSSIVEPTEGNDSKIISNNNVIENWKKTGTIKLTDEIERDSDSDFCTEL